MRWFVSYLNVTLADAGFFHIDEIGAGQQHQGKGCGPILRRLPPLSPGGSVLIGKPGPSVFLAPRSARQPSS